MNLSIFKDLIKISLFTFLIDIYSFAGEKFEEHYPNGQLKTSGEMKNQQMTGFWQRYRENGSLVSEGNWKENKPIGFWKHLNEKDDVEKFGNYSCEQKIGLWKEEESWKYYRPKKSCFGYWFSFLRVAGTYNHQNSREYSYSTHLSWNPDLFHLKQFIFGLGLGSDFLKEQEETVDDERVGQNQTYPSFSLELQFRYAFTNSAPNQLEFFVGAQEFQRSNSETASIYGFRYLLHNKVLIPQLIDKFFLGYKRVTSSDVTFDQLSAGLKFNF